MLVPKPLILFIDAYDSFSNNIISLLETTLDVSIRTIKIDDPALNTEVALHEELRHYAAVVCGPGPGHPFKEQDVGVTRRIWKLSEKEMLPVLGICLGLQSLCLEFGAEVKRLKGPQHGIMRRLCHAGAYEVDGRRTIFHDVGEVTATLYQSLCVDIGQDSIPDDQWQTKKWEASKRCPDIIPLAWAEHDLSVANDAGVEDERVLVAVQHASKPFWALQYHPESICTNPESKKVLQQWFDQAKSWNKYHRQRRISFSGPIQGQFAVRDSLLRQMERMKTKPSSGSIRIPANYPGTLTAKKLVCHSLVVPIPANASLPEIVEAVEGDSGDRIILESSNGNDKSPEAANVRGRYSIISLNIDGSLRFEYTVSSERLTVIYGELDAYGERKCQSTDTEADGGIWPLIAKYLDERQVDEVVPREVGKESPFWGGFMGYTTYELGLESIGVASGRSEWDETHRPDLCFAWITRSLVVDHIKNIVYVQELAPMSEARRVAIWQNGVRKSLEEYLYPLECFAPSTITFSNLADGTTKEQLLRCISKQGLGLPCSIKLHHENGIFSGIATTHHHTDTKAFRCSSRDRNFHLNGNLVYMRDMSRPIEKESRRTFCESTRPEFSLDSVISITAPRNEEYEDKVRLCQENIRAGDSYELCLTDQTLVTLKKSHPTNSWEMYKSLRSRQPAPFASFIKLGSATLVSASPERFLKYSSDGQCELRPMKGTVRKSAEISTLAQATALLDVPKEKAENLMIVDLVRHDLYGVCGSGNVSVPRLMVVEEYKSVFQMISIVQGAISLPITPDLSQYLSKEEIENKKKERYTGLDVLAASLPPGSMTGAPKKRSCEILQDIEGGMERSLYSGVVGYMDVAGRGDWSVNIRCMFKWDDEDSNLENEKEFSTGIETETWHIGAGGAVTALSTPVGEREEMVTKLSGTLGLFRE